MTLASLRGRLPPPPPGTSGLAPLKTTHVACPCERMRMQQSDRQFAAKSDKKASCLRCTRLQTFKLGPSPNPTFLSASLLPPFFP